MTETGRECIDALEIYEHIRDVRDPEHPYTLEQLKVVREEHIEVDDNRGRVRCVVFSWWGYGRPRYPHCLVKSSSAINTSDPHSALHSSHLLGSVTFTPTVEHCSMATLIGLCIRVKLLRVLPPRFKVDVCLAPGSHDSEAAVNKQLNDKERVAAALENPNLLQMVNSCCAAA